MTVNTPIWHPRLGWVLMYADGTYEPLAPAEQAEWDVLEKTLDGGDMSALVQGG